MDWKQADADRRRAEVRAAQAIERDKKVHLFAIYGVSMPEAVAQKLVSVPDYKLTAKGVYWMQKRASGDSEVPSYSFWEQIAVTASAPFTDPYDAAVIVKDEVIEQGKRGLVWSYETGQWVVEKAVEGQAGLVQDTLWAMFKGAMKKPLGAAAMALGAWYGGKYVLKGVGIYAGSKLKAVGSRGKTLPPKILTLKAKRPPAIVNVTGKMKGKN